MRCRKVVLQNPASLQDKISVYIRDISKHNKDSLQQTNINVSGEKLKDIPKIRNNSWLSAISIAIQYSIRSLC